MPLHRRKSFLTSLSNSAYDLARQNKLSTPIARDLAFNLRAMTEQALEQELIGLRGTAADDLRRISQHASASQR